MGDPLEPKDIGKHDRQNNHQNERIEHCPEEPDNGPLVADGEVSPDEVQQQIGIFDDSLGSPYDY